MLYQSMNPIFILGNQVERDIRYRDVMQVDTQISTVAEVSYVISLLRMRNGAKCHYYRGRNGESIFIAKNEGRLMGHFLLTTSQAAFGLS